MSEISKEYNYFNAVNPKGRLVGISSSGSRIGNVFALSFGGYLCVNGFLLYFTHLRVPWKRILTSKACWSIFIGHFTHNWGSYLFLTQTPSFLKDVLKFDLKSNGLISSIPYIACWLFINIATVISDKILQTDKMSKRNARRICTAIGTLAPSFLIIGLSFINCHHVFLGVVLLTLGVGFDSMMTGYLININDIAGPYSGIVFGFSNTIATIPGLISPYIASSITTHQTAKEWQIVFIICAVVYFVGGSLCIALLETEIQPWAIIEKKAAQSDLENDKNLFN